MPWTPAPFAPYSPTGTEHAIALPDAFPVVDGHMLVVPRRHVSSIYQLERPEQTAIWELVSEVRQRLLTGLKPDGFNIGLNDGLAEGTVGSAAADARDELRVKRSGRRRGPIVRR